MIVKCENCQTRFKIPDDKVTEKGVKVRCTKCSHTFRVKRDADGSALIIPAAPSAAAPVAGVPENPFAQFSPPAGGEMFSKNTRVAPLPSRPEVVKPGAHQEVTKRGPAPTDVTKRGPVPSRDDLAAVFGVEPEAVTNPAMAFGKVSSTARTDPAAVYGGGQLPSLPGFTPAPPPVSAGPPPAPPAPPPSAMNIQIDSALPPGPPPRGFVPAGFEPSANTIPSSGPTSGNHPHAGPKSSAPETGSDPFALGPGAGGFPAAGPPGAPDRSLFDIPPPPPEPAGPSPELDGTAGMGFGGSMAPGLDVLAQPVRPSPMMAPPQKPSGKPDDARGVEEYSEPGAARRYAGLITNLAVAAGLVLLLVTGGSVYLNEGKVDLSAFSKDRMAGLFTSKRTAAVADVSNGLYETRSGRAVFFVRGVVHNRTDAPLHAKVRAEILDGAELVRAAEGMAGAAPTPEDVYGITSAADQAKLAAKLNAEAKPVPPGAEVPFFLLFNFGDVQQSPDLANYRLRVTVSEGAMTADAAAPR